MPGGPCIPLITLGLCGWLLYNVDPVKLIMGGFALYIGAIIWSLQKRRSASLEVESARGSDRTSP